jgi:cold shock CspA family protein
MTTIKGTILYWKAHEDGTGFGFIVPVGCNGHIDKEKNVYFNSIEGGTTPRAGDRVEFELNTLLRKKGPRAFKVWLSDDGQQVTTLHGAEEYQ